MRLGPVVLILAYLLSVSLPASGTWTAGPVARELEPNTPWDRQDNVMFNEPAWPSPQYHLDLSLDAWTLGGPIVPVPSAAGASPWPVVVVSAHALMGKWLDCTRDGVFGDASLLGMDTYDAEPVDRCGGGSWIGHFRHSRLHEFAAIGPNAVPEYDCQFDECSFGDPMDIHDALSVVWMDLGPPEDTSPSRTVFPFPRGTLDTVGGHLDYLDWATYGSVSTAPGGATLWPVARDTFGAQEDPVTQLVRDRYNDSAEDHAPGTSPIGQCWRPLALDTSDPWGPVLDAVEDPQAPAVEPTATAVFRAAVSNCDARPPLLPANLEADANAFQGLQKTAPDAMLYFLPARTFNPLDYTWGPDILACVPDETVAERCGGEWTTDRQWLLVTGLQGAAVDTELSITATAYGDLFRQTGNHRDFEDRHSGHRPDEANHFYPAGIAEAWIYGWSICSSGLSTEPWACDPQVWMDAQGADGDDPYRHAVAAGDFYDLRDTDCRTLTLEAASLFSGYACGP